VRRPTRSLYTALRVTSDGALRYVMFCCVQPAWNSLVLCTNLRVVGTEHGCTRERLKLGLGWSDLALALTCNRSTPPPSRTAAVGELQLGSGFGRQLTLGSLADAMIARAAAGVRQQITLSGLPLQLSNDELALALAKGVPRRASCPRAFVLIGPSRHTVQQCFVWN
jgi:hypothetical protein